MPGFLLETPELCLAPREGGAGAVFDTANWDLAALAALGRRYVGAGCSGG